MQEFIAIVFNDVLIEFGIQICFTSDFYSGLMLVNIYSNSARKKKENTRHQKKINRKKNRYQVNMVKMCDNYRWKIHICEIYAICKHIGTIRWNENKRSDENVSAILIWFPLLAATLSLSLPLSASLFSSEQRNFASKIQSSRTHSRII